MAATTDTMNSSTTTMSPQQILCFYLPVYCDRVLQISIGTTLSVTAISILCLTLLVIYAQFKSGNLSKNGTTIFVLSTWQLSVSAMILIIIGFYVGPTIAIQTRFPDSGKNGKFQHHIAQFMFAFIFSGSLFNAVIAINRMMVMQSSKTNKILSRSTYNTIALIIIPTGFIISYLPVYTTNCCKKMPKYLSRQKKDSKFAHDGYGYHEGHVMAELYENAKTRRNESTRSLINTHMGIISDEARLILPSTSNISRAVRRKKRESGFLFPEPHNIAEVDINALRQIQTSDGQLLVYDVYQDMDNFALILATERNLERLSSCQVVACDGTFKPVPKHIRQLWVLHGYIEQTFVPLVFVLMSNQTELLYSHVLESLPNLHANECFVLDFERSQLNALRRAYPTSKFIGCMFHYSQANVNKMNDNGFKKKVFREDSELRFALRKFFMLGFARDVDIIDSFNMMAEELRFLTGHNQAGTENYLSYVKRTWIGFDDANGYHPPLFNHNLWNYYESTHLFSLRSNCAIEAWNGAFAQSLPNNKGKLNWSRFFESLAEEHANIELKILDAERAAAGPLSERELQIKAILDVYDEYETPVEYFNDLSRILHGE